MAGQFGLILCLDVLEHFVDPWRAVDRLVREYLAEGGAILVSVPNVRHYSVLRPLVSQGGWNYTDRGRRCNTCDFSPMPRPCSCYGTRSWVRPDVCDLDSRRGRQRRFSIS